MQRVKAPPERHRVLAPMHKVTDQVEQQEACQEAHPGFGDRPRRKIDAQQRFEPRAGERRRLEKNAARNRLETQKSMLRNRRRTAGNSRRLRGWQNSHSPTARKLPMKWKAGFSTGALRGRSRLSLRFWAPKSTFRPDT
jgi:hypothetical protein